jgi:hypothetical protein
MLKISAFLYRFSKPFVLLSATIVFLFFAILVLPAEAGKSLAQTGSSLSPDTMLFYDAETLYDLAQTYGLQGRIYYVQSRVTFDVVWPVAYVVFFLVAISFLWNPLLKAPKWRWINLIPFLGFGFDLLENTTVSIVMARYPETSDFFAFIAPFFTTMKWLAILASLLLLVAGIGGSVYKTLSALARRKDLE